MIRQGNISKKLLTSYITGNCSDAEKIRVEQWIKASKNNAGLYNEFRTVWSLTSPVTSIPDFDKEKALQAVADRISRVENSPYKLNTQKSQKHTLRKIYRFTATAAAVIILLFAIYIVTNTPADEAITSIVAQEKVLDPVILPDGSKVYLNNHTSISFSSAFNKTERSVALEGEAFFEVVSDQARPFIVKAENTAIKVLGTSFNFSAVSDLHTIEISVLTGKVLFYSFDPETGDVLEQVVLEAGETGIFHKNDNIISKSSSQNTNAIGWKSGVLEFNNAPLEDVFKSLESAYNFRFNVERSLDHLNLTARFNNEEPENVLETLKLIFGFNLEQTDNKIRIY